MPTTKASKPWPKLLGFNLARWVDAEEENVRQFTAPVEGMPTYTISLSIILFVIVDYGTGRCVKNLKFKIWHCDIAWNNSDSAAT